MRRPNGSNPSSATTSRGSAKALVAQVRPRQFVHTSTVLPAIDCEEIDGVAVMSPTRTIIDLAVTAAPQPLTVALDSALRDRKTTETFLNQRIAALRGSGGD